jgi:ribosomal protein S27E
MTMEGGSLPSLDEFPNVYCPTCRRVQPARFELLKADAYIDHASIDIVCSECGSVIASLHADKPDVLGQSGELLREEESMREPLISLNV